ncbi:hypothetical protein BKA66DRAFT_44782 [Pyrenochaeta sp. MPI-SDFR-AT-0127]|nr:hypothetical protein BKA66DRAFT_44782 [Pyrenochaeta sp. MPI-SDFR-AT-0127]
MTSTVGPENEERLKKRRTAPRVSQACRACASSKVRCDNATPCHRCRKKRLFCTRQTYTEDGSLQPVPSNNDDVDLAQSSTLLPDMYAAAEPLFVFDDALCTNGIFDFSLINTMEWAGLSPINPLPNEMQCDKIASSNVTAAQNNSTSHNAGSGVCAPQGSVFTGVADLAEASRAYSDTRGYWHPKTKHDATQDLLELFITAEDCRSVADSLKPLDLTITLEAIPNSRRDEMLAVVAKNCSMPQTIPNLVSFPPTETLDSFLKVFLTSQKEQRNSFIHLPTFDPLSCDMSLLMTCIAAGATFSPNTVAYRFGVTLLELVRRILPSLAEQENRLTRATSYLQSHVIFSEAALWSGDKRMSEISDIMCAFPTTMMRHGLCLSQKKYPSITPSVDETHEQLQETWKSWIEIESLKRTIFQHMAQCVQRAIVRASPPQLSFSETSAPLPDRFELWKAKSAAQWRTRYFELGVAQAMRRLSLIDCVVDLDNIRKLSRQQDARFASTMVAFSILSLLVEDRSKRVVFRSQAGTSRPHSTSPAWIDPHIAALLESAMALTDSPKSVPNLATADFMHEFCGFYAAAPIHVIETLLGTERHVHNRDELSRLSEWRRTQQARTAVWHAGQLFRIIRKVLPEERTDFQASALLHAVLGLWAFAMASEDASSTADTADQNTCPNSSEAIRLDGLESIQSQRWIQRDQGVPYVADTGAMIGVTEQSTGLIRLTRDFAIGRTFLTPLAHNLEDLFSARVTKRRYPIIANARQVLQALERVLVSRDS